MTNNNIADLQNMDLGKTLIDEDLSKYTTYKVGGKAKVLVFPENKEKLLELLKYIKENNLKYFVMGNGSNLLISSKVFDGVVIKLNKLNNVQIYDNEVYVEAGYPLIKLCMLCADNNLGNLEFASGIPACIGGAICSNAGAYKMEMSDIVESVTVIDKDLNIVTLLKDDLKFAYRDSIFKEDKSYIIISAMLKLEYKDKSEILEIMESRKQRRLESQPLEYPSAGSVFRNPDAAPSGKLIEDAGLKGYTIGGAKVSEKHANFIINYNNATSEDIKKLIDDMGNSKLTEISIDFPDGTKIGMKKEVKVVEKVQEKNIQHIEQKEVNEIVETETQEDNCKIVKSPMVGTFYLKPDPNSNPYVEIGKKVKKGDILCIIEAMKLMNEIECEFDGEIAEILVKDGEMVEYGKPLFKIK